MRFEQFYSGSSGNLYVATSNSGKRLMLECGVAWKKVQIALQYNLADICGCLVTHCHNDHCKAVNEVLKAGIQVHSSNGTFNKLELSGRKINPMEAMKQYVIGEYKVVPFNTIHDCEEPFGFLINCDDQWLLFATDTAYIKQKFEIPFSIICIECSYEKDVLTENVESGVVNESLAKRLLTSHMEKEVTKRYVSQFCNLRLCQELHLLHLSGQNIADKKAVREEFERDLMLKTVVC